MRRAIRHPITFTLRVTETPADRLRGVARDLDRWARGFEAAEYAGWARDFRTAAAKIRAALHAMEASR